MNSYTLIINFFLDFTNFVIDTNTEIATVSLIEENEVVYELSRQLNPEKPIVSRHANIKHKIILHKQNGEWKIISDDYDDYLWRMLRQRGLSSTEMLHTIETLPMVETSNIESALAYPSDSSSHVYDRDGASNYAINHAGNPNPNYYNYENIGGDCTNFISQAIYEGGGASMWMPPGPCRPQLGWQAVIAPQFPDVT